MHPSIGIDTTLVKAANALLTDDSIMRILTRYR